MSYNGWTNRETWLVNMWFDPQSREDVKMARETMVFLYNDLPDGPIKDMIDLDSINWDELLEHFEDEEEDEDQENLDIDLDGGLSHINE